MDAESAMFIATFLAIIIFSYILYKFIQYLFRQTKKICYAIFGKKIKETEDMIYWHGFV
jgi:peptidoglycan/LPS O-acetylase OafA/YrhL